jgi:segregation and condensation protein A
MSQAAGAVKQAPSASPESPSHCDSLSPDVAFENFAGPIDVLLDLVQRQRIDLSGISIVDLANQFVAALGRLGSQVPLERQGEWVVTATWLVLLKSRLLLPASPEEAMALQREAAAELSLLEERAAMQRAASWLSARPQLGQEVFPRGMPARRSVHTLGFAALLEAGLIVFRGTEGRPEEAVYRPVLARHWSMADAFARVRARLADVHEGAPLEHFLPALPVDETDRDRRARAAIASTLMAGLELAREGELTLHQNGLFATIDVRASLKPEGDAPNHAL